MVMKAIHPFPARMAPETVSEWLFSLNPQSVIFDPMCGSGVVVRQAAMLGHRAIGADTDPLAVLMSRVWTQKIDTVYVQQEARKIADKSSNLDPNIIALPWIDNCEETKRFVSYWFEKKQADDLRRLSYVLKNSKHSRKIRNALYLALSRTIITKHYGASLAWDVSHSRPHKVKKGMLLDRQTSEPAEYRYLVEFCA